MFSAINPHLYPGNHPVTFLLTLCDLAITNHPVTFLLTLCDFVLASHLVTLPLLLNLTHSPNTWPQTNFLQFVVILFWGKTATNMKCVSIAIYYKLNFNQNLYSKTLTYNMFNLLFLILASTEPFLKICRTCFNIYFLHYLPKFILKRIEANLSSMLLSNMENLNTISENNK